MKNINFSLNPFKQLFQSENNQQPKRNAQDRSVNDAFEKINLHRSHLIYEVNQLSLIYSENRQSDARRFKVTEAMDDKTSHSPHHIG
jgi:hypothetical protein